MELILIFIISFLAATISGAAGFGGTLLFLPVLTSVVGSYLFIDIDSKKIKIGIGIFLVLIGVYRRLNINKIAFGNKGMLIDGGVTGFLSGLAESAGAIGAAFFLGLNLTATAYVASGAFTVLTMHLTKTIVYGKYSLIGLTELYYVLFIGVAMILGSWTGKRIIEKLSKTAFIIFVEILLVISGIQMIISGLN